MLDNPRLFELLDQILVWNNRTTTAVKQLNDYCRETTSGENSIHIWLWLNLLNFRRTMREILGGILPNHRALLNKETKRQWIVFYSDFHIPVE